MCLRFIAGLSGLKDSAYAKYSKNCLIYNVEDQFQMLMYLVSRSFIQVLGLCMTVAVVTR